MTSITSPATLRIGEVATAAAVSVQAVRYYEQRGLLSPLHRTAASYRVYGPESIRVVRFIKRAQELGFTLDEIAQLLQLRWDALGGGAKARPLAESKVADMDERIRALTAMRDGLRTLVKRCRCGTKRPISNGACPILDALESGHATVRRTSARTTAHTS